MKAAYLLSFLHLALVALAIPADQLVLGDVTYGDELALIAGKTIQGAHDVLKSTKEKWLDAFGLPHILQNGIACMYCTFALHCFSSDRSRRARPTSRLPRIPAASHRARSVRPGREAVLRLSRYRGG